MHKIPGNFPRRNCKISRVEFEYHPVWKTGDADYGFPRTCVMPAPEKFERFDVVRFRETGALGIVLRAFDRDVEYLGYSTWPMRERVPMRHYTVLWPGSFSLRTAAECHAHQLEGLGPVREFVRSWWRRVKKPWR